MSHPGGEIGRRAVFRRLCLRACWFESSSGYKNSPSLVLGFFVPSLLPKFTHLNPQNGMWSYF